MEEGQTIELWEWVGIEVRDLEDPDRPLKRKFIDSRYTPVNSKKVLKALDGVLPNNGKSFGPIDTPEGASKMASRIRNVVPKKGWKEGYAIGKIEHEGKWYVVVMRGAVEKKAPQAHAIIDP